MSHKSLQKPALRWQINAQNPVVVPGRINGDIDAGHAGSSHVLDLGDRYRLYYWAQGSQGKAIAVAESDPAAPNDWRPLGCALTAQPETDYNANGPSFPFVLPRDDAPWLMYFGAWGRRREDGKLANSTGLAQSEDAGLTWEYVTTEPLIPFDRPYDCEGTGSCCVVRVGDEYRMYYTAIGSYFPKPDGVRTGHGDVIPRIGVGYATSDDGVRWTKPLDDLMVSPRGFETEPYEYISSKPFVIRSGGDGDGWRMWVSTFGPAYRIRSLVSDDGLDWTWVPSGIDGDLGVGEPGEFDDHQRCYASVVRTDAEYRLWFTANGFGRTGMGYATAPAP